MLCWKISIIYKSMAAPSAIAARPPWTLRWFWTPAPLVGADSADALDLEAVAEVEVDAEFVALDAEVDMLLDIADLVLAADAVEADSEAEADIEADMEAADETLPVALALAADDMDSTVLVDSTTN